MEEVKVRIGDAELTLQGGVLFRIDDEAPYYCDVGIMSNGNKILFYYTDATDIVDYVETIINNISTAVVDYLENIINNNEGILVRCWYSPGSKVSCFEIYYDADCKSNEILDIIDWMGEHNDFAMAEYCYTQVRNGHQTICC